MREFKGRNASELPDNLDAVLDLGNRVAAREMADRLAKLERVLEAAKEVYTDYSLSHINSSATELGAALAAVDGVAAAVPDVAADLAMMVRRLCKGRNFHDPLFQDAMALLKKYGLAGQILRAQSSEPAEEQ